MQRFLKWKKGLHLAFAAGIIGLATYGIYHTICSFDNLPQEQSISYAPVSGWSCDGNTPVPDDSSCYPYLCAQCAGCVQVQYEQNVEIIPLATLQIDRIY